MPVDRHSRWLAAFLSLFLLTTGAAAREPAAGETGLLTRLSLGVPNDGPLLGGALQKTMAQITPEERDGALRKRFAVNHAPKSIFETQEFRLGMAIAAGVILLVLAGAFIWNRALRTRVLSRTREARLSEARYRNLIDAAEISIWDEDLTGVLRGLGKLRTDGVEDLRRHLSENPAVAEELAARIKINTVNDATLALFGAASKEQFVSCIDKVFAGDSERVFVEELCAIWNGERAFRSETSHLTLGGQPVEIILSMPIPKNEAEAQSVPVIIVDVTERKRAEEVLRQSEARYRDLIERSQLGILIGGRESGRVYVNPACVNLHGYDSLAEILAVPRGGLIAPDDLERMRKCRDMLLNGEADVDSQEFQGICKNGSKIPLQVFMRRITWEGEELVQRTYIDLTDSKNAERALLESEGRLRLIFESGTTGNIVINESGIIEDVNSAALEMFGYRSDEMLGQNVAMLMPEPDQSRHDGYIDRYLQTGEAKVIGFDREATGLRKNGETFPIRLGIGELSLGDHRSFIGALTDLTEFKTLEHLLIQAQKMEAVGQLTGGIAHDFNNLLAATMSNAELLELELDGRDDLLDMVGSIVAASRRGAELTHRLLAFSRQQTLQPKSVQLAELCAGMSNLLRRSLGETIEIALTADGEIWNVMADPGQVESAVLNLAINASHAMPDGGNLEILIENAPAVGAEWARRWEGLPGDYVALRVADTGTGMPADVLAHVIEPFFTTREVGQGSGLGLSMVYGFAQQSGGFVAIESKEAKGTTVSIYLPRAEDDRTGAENQTMDTALPVSRGETILLVEDEPGVRDATTRVLQRLGYTVLIAEDGPAALAISANAERIDLLLSDMTLPKGMNGIDICRRLHEQRPGLKCLFMSGYASLPDQPLPEGAEILSKPVAIGVLAAKTREVLDA